MPIRKLSPDMAAKIAAGEVIERPASVVKELLENAIDAGADAIRVEIESGGKRLMRVSDDGRGIPAAEVPLAFERHTTSKLATLDDLFRVRTLGFRGEALGSMAAVSRLGMLTRPASEPDGTQIHFEGGILQSHRTAGAPAGTVISVENLFFNVPARLKFLKADATESGHIHRVVTHYALAYPEIRFTFSSGGRQIFQTDGSDSLFDVLIAVWGLERARELIEVAGESAAGVQVSGYVGSPAVHRGQRDQVILFINRRWVQDRSLAHAVAQAYHTFLPVGRHPVAVLNVTLDPAEVDVNVHPTKAEVKFRDPRAVFSAVQRPVRAAITDSAPLVRPAQTLGRSEPSFGGGFGGHAGDMIEARSGRDWNQLGFEAQRTLPGAEPESAEEGRLPPLRVVGQIQQTYVITEGPNGLYLIDQHAAHERILYEKLMAQRAESAVASQRLLDPLLLELTPAEAAVLEAEWAALAEVGFELEPFGGQTYRLLAVPEMLARSDLLAAFSDILAEMAVGALPMARETHEKVAIIVCKRASIKGGQTLSYAEMEALIRQLEASENPRTCPHGRPTMIHMSTYQLAREFGRH